MAIRVPDRVRAAAMHWRAVAALSGYALLCEIGVRVGLPGVDGGRVQAFLAGSHRWLLDAYNAAAGGGLSRAAVLALGVVPYLQAKAYIAVARALSFRARQATGGDVVRPGVVLGASAALAIIQSAGFAEFLQRIPGAVPTPGYGFIAQTALLVTGATLVVGWLSEGMIAAPGDESASSQQKLPSASQLRSSLREPERDAVGASTPDLSIAPVRVPIAVRPYEDRRAEI